MGARINDWRRKEGRIRNLVQIKEAHEESQREYGDPSPPRLMSKHMAYVAYSRPA